jgi:SPP1 family predicted phage head-tail adaptor
MEAGKLRHRITIQQKILSRDADGYAQETWTDLKTCWARKITTGGREFYAAQKVNGETTAVFVLRYTPGITREMRVKDGNRFYDIIAPPNEVDGKHEELQLLTRERV